MHAVKLAEELAEQGQLITSTLTRFSPERMPNYRVNFLRRLMDGSFPDVVDQAPPPPPPPPPPPAPAVVDPAPAPEMVKAKKVGKKKEGKLSAPAPAPAPAPSDSDSEDFDLASLDQPDTITDIPGAQTPLKQGGWDHPIGSLEEGFLALKKGRQLFLNAPGKGLQTLLYPGPIFLEVEEGGLDPGQKGPGPRKGRNRMWQRRAKCVVKGFSDLGSVLLQLLCKNPELLPDMCEGDRLLLSNVRMKLDAAGALELSGILDQDEFAVQIVTNPLPSGKKQHPPTFAVIDLNT